MARAAKAACAPCPSLAETFIECETPITEGRRELCLHYSAGGNIAAFIAEPQLYAEQCACVYTCVRGSTFILHSCPRSVHKFNIICYPPKLIILSGPMLLSQWDPGESPGPCHVQSYSITYHSLRKGSLVHLVHSCVSNPSVLMLNGCRAPSSLYQGDRGAHQLTERSSKNSTY